MKSSELAAMGLLCGVLMLAGCAGRAPEPVAVVQPGDRELDCPAIQAEIVANNKTVQGLGSEEGAKVAQNVAAGVVGLFIWPLWFAMDFQGAAGKEEAALQSRQDYLATLAIQRGCAGPGPLPAQASARAATAPIAVTPVSPAPPMLAAPAAVPMTPCGSDDHPCAGQSSSVGVF